MSSNPPQGYSVLQNQLIYQQDFSRANLMEFGCSDGLLKCFNITSKRAPPNGKKSLLLTCSNGGLQDCHQSWIQDLGTGVFTFSYYFTFDEGQRNSATQWIGCSLEYWDGINLSESAMQYLFDGTVKVLTTGHTFTTAGTPTVLNPLGTTTETNPLTTPLHGFNTSVAAGYGQGQGNEAWHRCIHTVDFINGVHSYLQIDNLQYASVKGIALDISANTTQTKGIMRFEYHYQGAGSSQIYSDKITAYYGNTRIYQGTVVPF